MAISLSLRTNIERLRRNRADYLLLEARIARNYLDCAASSSAPSVRERALRKALATVTAIEHFFDNAALTPEELCEIRGALTELRSRIVELEHRATPHPMFAPIIVPESLTRGDMVHLISPSKTPLFAGDLFRIALRLRISGRIQSK